MTIDVLYDTPTKHRILNYCVSPHLNCTIGPFLSFDGHCCDVTDSKIDREVERHYSQKSQKVAHPENKQQNCGLPPGGSNTKKDHYHFQPFIIRLRYLSLIHTPQSRQSP
jgi:hypothetical protein